MKYDNEKIIHSRSMRDFLVAHGGVLLREKQDLKNKKFKIYIFKEDSINNIMRSYTKGWSKND